MEFVIYVCKVKLRDHNGYVLKILNLKFELILTIPLLKLYFDIFIWLLHFLVFVYQLSYFLDQGINWTKIIFGWKWNSEFPLKNIPQVGEAGDGDERSENAREFMVLIGRHYI